MTYSHKPVTKGRLIYFKGHSVSQAASLADDTIDHRIFTNKSLGLLQSNHVKPYVTCSIKARTTSPEHLKGH